MQIDENKVIEVIGRLIGRSTSHRNSANQATNEKVARAHNSAADDLLSLAEDLALATSDPEYAKSGVAYRKTTMR